MTLLIACILINHFDMPWWWYLIAVVAWGLKIAYIRACEYEIKNDIFRIRNEALTAAGVDRAFDALHEKINRLR